MKIPLRFQITEYDCGTTALQNALSYLFDREEIPAELVKAIHNYTLDCYDEYGNFGQGGTSKESIELLSKWVTDYSIHEKFDVIFTKYDGKIITKDLLKKEIKSGAVVFIRCWQGSEHYVLITNIDSEYAYIWDSYYFDETYYDKDGEVEIVFTQPFSYNRKVKLQRLFNNTEKDFALPAENLREMVSIKRGNKLSKNLSRTL